MTEVRFMLLFGVAGDEDVIQVDEDERDATEDAIHQPLEHLGGILETKGHAEELPETKRSDDGRLGDICRHNRDLVVAAFQVTLEKIFLPARLPLKSCMWDNGYISSTMALLKHWKSPQGLQPPLGLETM